MIECMVYAAMTVGIKHDGFNRDIFVLKSSVGSFQPGLSGTEIKKWLIMWHVSVPGVA